MPLADPVGRCRRSRTRANGPERNDPSKDEVRSSAAVKRARHLSRTCVRLVHLFLYPFGPLISRFCFLSNRSRITLESYGFLPEMFIYDETATHRIADSISGFEMKFHILENVYTVPQNALECKDRVKVFFRILDFSTFFFVIRLLFCFYYIHIENNIK